MASAPARQGPSNTSGPLPSDPDRLQDLASRPWPELRNSVLNYLERLDYEMARSLLRDIGQLPNRPPHADGFIHDMTRFSGVVGDFRRELFAAAKRPGAGIVISSSDYGPLTLISTNETHLLFQNIYNSPIQLSPNQLTSQEIVHIGNLLKSNGHGMPAFEGYRAFLARRAEIMDSSLNGPPDMGRPQGANGQRRPPVLPPLGSQDRGPNGLPRPGLNPQTSPR
jgi:hypothetical protein